MVPVTSAIPVSPWQRCLTTLMLRSKSTTGSASPHRAHSLGPLHSNPAVNIPAATCTQLRAWACIEMRGLEPGCADNAQWWKVSALADSLGAGLELVEDLQGAPISERGDSLAAPRCGILLTETVRETAALKRPRASSRSRRHHSAQSSIPAPLGCCLIGGV